MAITNEVLKKINGMVIPFIARAIEVYANTRDGVINYDDALNLAKRYLFGNRKWNQLGGSPAEVLNDHQVVEYVNSLYWGEFTDNGNHVLCYGEREPVKNWHGADRTFNVHNMCTLSIEGSDTFGRNRYKTDCLIVSIKNINREEVDIAIIERDRFVEFFYGR